MIKENGSLRATDILEELKRNGPLSMNDKDARELAKKLKGTIKYSDFYGKANAIYSGLMVFKPSSFPAGRFIYNSFDSDAIPGQEKLPQVVEIVFGGDGLECVLLGIKKEYIDFILEIPNRIKTEIRAVYHGGVVGEKMYLYDVFRNKQMLKFLDAMYHYGGNLQVTIK